MVHGKSKLAISTGTHYCGVNANIDSSLLLASEADCAGVTVIVATGIAPGISNLMGVHAARQLEEVEQLQIGISWIADFQSGRELTPHQWLGDPEDNLAALHECITTIGWLLKILQKNGVQMCSCFSRSSKQSRFATAGGNVI